MKKLLAACLLLLTLTACSELELGSMCEGDMREDVERYGQPDDVTTARDDYAIYTTYEWNEQGVYITYYENLDSYRCERTVIISSH